MLSANGILTRFIVTRSDIITNQQSTGRRPSCFAPLATLSYRWQLLANPPLRCQT